MESSGKKLDGLREEDTKEEKECANKKKKGEQNSHQTNSSVTEGLVEEKSKRNLTDEGLEIGEPVKTVDEEEKKKKNGGREQERKEKQESHLNNTVIVNGGVGRDRLLDQEKGEKTGADKIEEDGEEEKKKKMSSIALEVLMAMSSVMRGINVITSFQQVMYSVRRNNDLAWCTASSSSFFLSVFMREGKKDKHQEPCSSSVVTFKLRYGVYVCTSFTPISLTHTDVSHMRPHTLVRTVTEPGR